MFSSRAPSSSSVHPPDRGLNLGILPLEMHGSHARHRGGAPRAPGVARADAVVPPRRTPTRASSPVRKSPGHGGDGQLRAEVEGGEADEAEDERDDERGGDVTPGRNALAGEARDGRRGGAGEEGEELRDAAEDGRVGAEGGESRRLAGVAHHRGVHERAQGVREERAERGDAEREKLGGGQGGGSRPALLIDDVNLPAAVFFIGR